ncbi:hypothetical protein SAMN00777080_3069 [Aquiflexum balticum DSM 16537]|uniref:Methylamine utilisation protein MauE domain-containing protein n=1 Tax=Aquiflexum balticum DSM 16537 TaxID=758820 RepID=A0A1W2H737_9BACT|nr:MauE/DoxX family redox-associated membrane protein [Aquiflexum balticum]SMD44448.1 hypothetical protein SAMN00777080_3069 [Aquiflexum balticum DSM 16537]
MMSIQKAIPTLFLIESFLKMILTALWGYSFFSKTITYQAFRISILNQPFSDSFGEVLSIIIPLIEFLLLVLFFVPRFSFFAFLGSLILLTVFSTYIGLVLVDAFDKIPCGCAGIFERISWEAHFWVNAGLVGIAGIGCGLRGKLDFEG